MVEERALRDAPAKSEEKEGAKRAAQFFLFTRRRGVGTAAARLHGASPLFARTSDIFKNGFFASGRAGSTQAPAQIMDSCAAKHPARWTRRVGGAAESLQSTRGAAAWEAAARAAARPHDWPAARRRAWRLRRLVRGTHTAQRYERLGIQPQGRTPAGMVGMVERCLGAYRRRSRSRDRAHVFPCALTKSAGQPSRSHNRGVAGVARSLPSVRRARLRPPRGCRFARPDARDATESSRCDVVPQVDSPPLHADADAIGPPSLAARRAGGPPDCTLLMGRTGAQGTKGGVASS